MKHPSAVLKKARRLEQLLQRVSAGESQEQIKAELGLELDEESLARQQAKYETGGSTWEALVDGRHGHVSKVHSELREWMYARKEADENLRASRLAEELQGKFKVDLSIGHINYLLRQRGLTAPPGRPYKEPPPNSDEKEEESTPEATSEAIDNAGLFFPGSSEERDGDR